MLSLQFLFQQLSLGLFCFFFLSSCTGSSFPLFKGSTSTSMLCTCHLCVHYCYSIFMAHANGINIKANHKMARARHAGWNKPFKYAHILKHEFKSPASDMTDECFGIKNLTLSHIRCQVSFCHDAKLLMQQP